LRGGGRTRKTEFVPTVASPISGRVVPRGACAAEMKTTRDKGRRRTTHTSPSSALAQIFVGSESPPSSMVIGCRLLRYR
jgi:hypothetical protein